MAGDRWHAHIVACEPAAAFQSIDRAILNPWFLPTFVGALVRALASTTALGCLAWALVQYGRSGL